MKTYQDFNGMSSVGFDHCQINLKDWHYDGDYNGL